MSLVSNNALKPGFSSMLLAVLGAIALYLTANYFADSGMTTVGANMPVSESLIRQGDGTKPLTPTTNAPTTNALDELPRNATNNFDTDSAPENRVTTESQAASAKVNASTSGDESPNSSELGSRVMRVIEEVQSRQLDGQWEEALNEMNALYADFDSLNTFEQVTLLNFYTNTLIRMEMWEESISAFSRILTIPELRPDLNARALLALGQLHSRIGDNQQAQGFFQEWLSFTEGKQGFEQQTSRVLQQLEELETK